MTEERIAKQSSSNLIDRIPPEKRFQPGVSGNPAGRPPNKDSITYQLKQALAKGEGIEAKKLAAMAIKEANAGSYPHFKEILDRTDGKVADRTDHTFDSEALMGFLQGLRGYSKKELPEGDR